MPRSARRARSFSRRSARFSRDRYGCMRNDGKQKHGGSALSADAHTPRRAVAPWGPGMQFAGRACLSWVFSGVKSGTSSLI